MKAAFLLWVLRGVALPGPPMSVFDYQPGRHGVHARNFLEGWQGHLMAGDYASYKALFTEGVTGGLAQLSYSTMLVVVKTLACPVTAVPPPAFAVR